MVIAEVDVATALDVAVLFLDLGVEEEAVLLLLLLLLLGLDVAAVFLMVNSSLGARMAISVSKCRAKVYVFGDGGV